MGKFSSLVPLVGLAAACSVDELPQSKLGIDGSAGVSGYSGSGGGAGTAQGGIGGGELDASFDADTTGGSGGGGTDSGPDAGGCPPGLGDCDSNPDNGCEQDLISSPGHCGSCGRDCLGSVCQDSKCERVLLHSQADDSAFKGPWGVTVDATHVYVAVTGGSSTGYVLRIDKDGNQPLKIAPSEPEPFDIVLHADDAYWTNNLVDAGSVRKVPKAGGTVTTLASDQKRPVGISVDATNVYWANNDGAVVNKLPQTGGGSPTVLAAGQSRPRSTVVDGAFVYFVDVNEGRVKKVPSAGGSVTNVVNGATGPWVLAVDPAGSNLFFSGYASDGGLFRAAKTAVGASPETLVANQNKAMYVHVDATHVYFATHESTTGIIARLPKSGGGTEILATDQVTPAGITTDDAWIYWTEYSGNRLSKLAK
jgi:hypothetical protein